MADWLLIRLPRPPAKLASWIVVDARGAMVEAPADGALALALPAAAGRHVCVLVPGTDVLLMEPELPAKAGTKLAQMVPYALEEQLAEDIDDLHFAIGRRGGVDSTGRRASDSSRTPVAIVARVLMDEWLSAVQAAGIVPESMYADTDLLPANPGQAVAWLDGDTVVMRPAGGAPVAMPADALEEALALALAQPADEFAVETRGAGLILYTGAAEWQQHGPAVEAVREKFDGIKVQVLTDGPLALLAQQLPSGAAINLLQGSYAPQTSHAVGWRAWRVAAILLACLVGLHLAGKATDLLVLKKRERSIDTSIDQAFRAAMPGEYNTTDARRRMQQRLVTVRGGGEFSGLLPALGALVVARNGAPGTVVQALSFREGAVDLKLAAPNAESLDRISRSLRDNGWQADLTAGNVAGSAYEGRIQIRPKGS
jgi:general secretion pathway protein L